LQSFQQLSNASSAAAVPKAMTEMAMLDTTKAVFMIFVLLDRFGHLAQLGFVSR
jgi:hypothetical protein